MEFRIAKYRKGMRNRRRSGSGLHQLSARFPNNSSHTTSTVFGEGALAIAA